MAAAKPPAEQRDFEIYYARVLMREARARRGTPFAADLTAWAANARRRASAINISPAQPDLFGSASA